MRYYHAAAGFPTKPTWLAAIKNNHYKFWPGLSEKLVSKYFPDASQVYRGHGRKIKAGLISTKEEEAHNIIDGEKAFYTATFNLKDEFDRKLYSDQTGRFPVTSFKGNQYIMVAYDMDISNAIMVEPMKNRTAGKMSKLTMP